MMDPRIMPCLQIALALCSSAAYFYAGDARKGIYWLAAAIITASVTY